MQDSANIMLALTNNVNKDFGDRARLTHLSGFSHSHATPPISHGHGAVLNDK